MIYHLVKLCFAMTILSLFAFSTAQIGQDCRNSTCSSGLECCFVVDRPDFPPFGCYDPDENRCILDEYHPITINFSCLCSTAPDQGCCNRQCYNTTTSYCNIGIGQVQLKGQCGPFTCGGNDLCCINNRVNQNPSQCYNPETHHCVVDEFNTNPRNPPRCLCGLNDQCCAGVCFDPTRYECNLGVINQRS